MHRLFRTVSGDGHAEKVSKQLKNGSFGSSDPRTGIEKLRGYRDLAESQALVQEALEKAYDAELAGDYPSAIKRYRVGLSAIEEGLKQNAVETGLGPLFDNVARWKKEIAEWQVLAEERLKDLRATASSSRGPARQVTRITKQAQPILRQNQNIQTRAIAPLAAKGKQSTKDGKLREIVLAEVLDTRPTVCWRDIAGLENAKQALQEMVILPTLRADLFQGLRAPARGLLLYGPPGNGKTLLAKALAHEAKSTFFNISASSLTSKWHGEAEKLVRTLFEVATELQPAIIFIDEIDSILSERSSGEHEASRRLKTQFLVEFDGVAQASSKVVVVGATNRPQELDDAVRRRLVKRIYIPMPDARGRQAMLRSTLEDQPTSMSSGDEASLVQATEGYSGSDLAALCREAAMQPIRELGARVSTVPAHKIRPIAYRDFQAAFRSIRPSVSQDQIKSYEDWTKSFGTHA